MLQIWANLLLVPLEEAIKGGGRTQEKGSLAELI
jgi:hypothetical protein